MNPSALSVLTAPLKGTELSTIVEIFTLLTILSVAPLVLVTLTSFTRIVVVLSFLRQALGTQQSPSNQIIIALSLFISFHVMARSEEHTSELQSRGHLVCRLLLEKKKN